MHYSEIADGRHKAHLTGVQIMNDKNGHAYPVFTWHLDDLEGAPALTSRSFFQFGNGSRNEQAIDEVRTWAKGWDGQDLGWFTRAFDFLQTLPVEVCIAHQAGKDGYVYTNITYVAPYKEETEVPAELPPRRRYILRDDVKPNMHDVWNAFLEGTQDLSETEREIIWVNGVHRAVPNKDQDLFTEEDWEKVIREFKGE